MNAVWILKRETQIQSNQPKKIGNSDRLLLNFSFLKLLAWKRAQDKS